MNIVEQIKLMVGSNLLSDEEILELRTFFSCILTEEENNAYQEACDNILEWEQNESYDDYDEFYYDPLEQHYDELAWDKQQQIDEMYNVHNHFTRGLGQSVINLDNYWFTSDEIEAFREIWQRRISAL